MSPKGKKIIWILVPLAVLYMFCLPFRLFRSPLSATLTAQDGTLMGARIAADGQWRFAPAKKVPEKFAKCIVTYEDKRFWWHPGIDFLSIGRAVRQNFSRHEVVSGASTITMQVIRLSRPDAPRNIGEKLLEAVLATRLELRHSKKKILLLYASNAPFGGNVVGIEAAAWRYFGRPAEDLSWAESAMLAVLPNAPALIHPGRNRDALQQKRDFLLDKLQAKGIIDDIECELAKDEPLPDSPLPMPDNAYHLLERLRAKGGDKAYTCTLDPALQERINGIARAHFYDYHQNMVDNMGILVRSVKTGDILAYYGNTKGLQDNLRGADVDMIPAPRSSGSTLKPILYAAMLDSGLVLPSTLIKDTPYNYNNFAPHNYARTFDGAVPADEVIERSLNVPSVRMLEKYGVPRFLQILKGMGFSTVTRSADHYGLSLILGGAEITLQDLVGAYWSMARKLTEDVDDPNAEKVDIPLSRASVWLTFNALSKAGRPEEESSWQDFSSGRKVAWKTGTSWGNRDAWSVGVTRDYVVGVWVGNSDGEGRSQMTGVQYASPVMFDVFAYLPASKWFEMPIDEMVNVDVCKQSGLPASRICPDVEQQLCPDVPIRPDPCPYHRTVHLDKEHRYQVNSSCYPVELMEDAVWFVLPPAQEWYYMKNHLDYRPLPPKHPDFDSATEVGNPIEIIYPEQNITVVTTRSLDGRDQGIVVKAAHTDPEAILFWHLDDSYLGQTRGEHDLLIHPEPGRHLLVAIDGNGYSRSVSFIAK